MISDFHDFTGPITTEHGSEKHDASKDRTHHKGHDTPKKVLHKRDTKDRLFPKEEHRKKTEDSHKREKPPFSEDRRKTEDRTGDTSEDDARTNTLGQEKRAHREHRCQKIEGTGSLPRQECLQSAPKKEVICSSPSAIANSGPSSTSRNSSDVCNTNSSFSSCSTVIPGGKKDHKKEEVHRNEKQKKTERVPDQLEKSIIKRSEGTKLKSWWCLHCHGWKERRARHTSSV